MNRKTLSIIGILVIVVLALLVFFFLRRSSIDTPVESLPRECLIFQSDDATRPCYRESSSTLPNTPVVIPSTPSYPTGTGATTSAVTMPTDCAVSDNTFERNDCVVKKAVESKKTELCSLVVGSLAQSACVRDTSPSVTVSKPIVNQSYETFLRSFSDTKPVGVSVGIISSTTQAPLFSTPQIDSRFSVEGLTDRFKGAPLVLFSISPYQVLPGGLVTLQGTGFDGVNDIHASGYSFSTTSTDGFTLSFPAPASPGEYDVWVTNSKGSSQVVGRMMRLIVTTSPAPLPVITSVTPNPAKIDDTITISGTGFSSSNNVSTSLGIMENVASSGNAISLRLSDFSLTSQIREIPYMKDRKTAILIYIQSDGGLSKDAYSFDVQF